MIITPAPIACATRLAARFLTLAVLLTLPTIANAQTAAARCYLPHDSYFPPPGDWERRSPTALGVDSARLADAIAFAQSHESSWPEGADMRETIALTIAGEPFNGITGPAKPRGPVNGLVIRNGYIIAEWGDTERVDMTFSVSKTYLSTVGGLAVDRGIIRSVHDSVRAYVRDGDFDDAHNAGITWHHLFNQTSGWEGTLWGKPDWADRFNGTRRPRQAPGTAYVYNDVRVNRLALALLQVWRQPLPKVLRKLVMDPIGASPTWEWHGYEDSWVTIDGVRMQSVSGGGHWGGGLWISSRDHARFGYMVLRCGEWAGRQILSRDWIVLANTPTPQNPEFGYMNWVQHSYYPSAEPSSYFFLGGNLNMVWIDPARDLVVISRWVDVQHMDEFVRRMTEAVPPMR